jgi:hypothetical protein
MYMRPKADIGLTAVATAAVTASIAFPALVIYRILVRDISHVDKTGAANIVQGKKGRKVK